MSANRRRPAVPAVVLALTVLAALLTGCRVSVNSDETAVAAQVDRSHRFEVDLTGTLPTREQVGLEPGRSVQSYTEPDNGLTLVVRLDADRTFTTPASSVVVGTTQSAVTTPRSPDAPDELVLPNEVTATQTFTTRDEGRALLRARADLFGIDPDDIDLWYGTAPEAAAPNVLLDKMYFDHTASVGVADLTAAVFMSSDAYIIWYVSWDPPIPGYTYDSSGVPQPQAS